MVNLKNADLDLIQGIHPYCGFQGFLIRFWICSKTRKILSEFRKSRFAFSPNNALFFFSLSFAKLACYLLSLPRRLFALIACTRFFELIGGFQSRGDLSDLETEKYF